jgi:hypothetical protein
MPFDFNPFKEPALAFILQQQIWATRTQQILIASGMGVQPQILDFTEDEWRYVETALMQARHTPVNSWRGFDVRHLIHQQGAEYRQFDVFCVLDAATKYLNQEALDFLTMRDRPGMVIDCNLDAERYNMQEDVSKFWYVEENEVRLSLAFRAEMVKEAATNRRDIATGAYVMLREPLPRLDELIAYDELRLLVTRHGIGVSIISGNFYIPFWWSPELDTNTSQVWVPSAVRFALDVLMACIWRDACIVKEEMLSTPRNSSRGYKATGKPQHNSEVVRLPRVIYKTQWGSRADRETVESISKRAHVVRGHYRFIRDEYEAPEELKEAALDYGLAAPPRDFTFVRPHTRGTGEAMPSVRRVICKGLQVAKTVLG